MPVALYADVHVPHPITSGLRLRGIDVLTVQEDGRRRCSDSELIDRAGELGRVMITFDKDFLAEAVRRQVQGISFSGVLYLHPLRRSYGRFVEILAIYALAGDREDFLNRVEFV